MGSGAQGAPWIHLDDVLGLIELALQTSTLQGALNAVAPGHVTQAQFTHSLAKVLGRPQWLKVPAFVLRGLLGEMSQLLVDGQHVVPAAALAAGYHFKHPKLEQALRNLLD
jgi:NAD dependent epimerase/dehydratase family enzyme